MFLIGSLYFESTFSLSDYLVKIKSLNAVLKSGISLYSA